jgi:NAD(P)-dependent dehydrogenase (short-subunit alcohol dehydrogenase family)
MCVSTVSRLATSHPMIRKRVPRRPLEEQTRLEPVGEKKGTESEIAQAVLFLAKNRFITGEVLNIDNGEFLHNPVN